MKIAPLASVGLLVVLLAGGGGAWLHHERVQAVRDLSGRLDALSQELTGLRAELATQRSSEINSAQRDAILKVVADERAQRQQSEEQARRQRFAQLCIQNADRAAKKFGLSEDQRNGYADVLRRGEEKLVAADARMRDLFTKTDDLQARADATESVMKELKDWRLKELAERVGSDLAQKINEDIEFGVLADYSRLETSRQAK